MQKLIDLGRGLHDWWQLRPLVTQGAPLGLVSHTVQAENLTQRILACLERYPPHMTTLQAEATTRFHTIIARYERDNFDLTVAPKPPSLRAQRISFIGDILTECDQVLGRIEHSGQVVAPIRCMALSLYLLLKIVESETELCDVKTRGVLHLFDHLSSGLNPCESRLYSLTSLAELLHERYDEYATPDRYTQLRARAFEHITILPMMESSWAALAVTALAKQRGCYFDTSIAAWNLSYAVWRRMWALACILDHADELSTFETRSDLSRQKHLRFRSTFNPT